MNAGDVDRATASEPTPVLAMALRLEGHESERVLDEHADGATITLAVGQRLALRLRSLGEEGSGAWVLAIPDEAVLGLRLALHEASTPGTKDGADVFTFEGIAPGRTRLLATATRAWAGGGARTFTQDVIVR